jgi:hypothetical protein
LTSLRCGVECKSVFTPALAFDWIPKLTVQTFRLLALSGCCVIDRISRIATAGIIIWVVCLILVAFSDTGFIREVVDLPSLTGAIDRGAFIEMWIPFGAICTGWNLTYSCGFVEDGLLREAFASVVFFVVGMVDLAANHTFF